MVLPARCSARRCRHDALDHAGLAASAGSDLCPSDPTAYVLRLRDDFEMIGVATRRIAAEVIDDHATRNVPHRYLIHEPMGEDDKACADAEPSVAMMIACGCPIPAARFFVDLNLRGEAQERSHEPRSGRQRCDLASTTSPTHLLRAGARAALAIRSNRYEALSAVRAAPALVLELANRALRRRGRHYGTVRCSSA